MTSPAARTRTLRKVCKALDLDAELLRTRKHQVWEIRAADGRTLRVAVSLSPSCKHSGKNLEALLRRFAHADP